MLTSVLALASVGATLGVHAVEIRDLPLERAIELAHGLARELGALSGDRAIAGGELWNECSDEKACARELAARDGTSGVILLRLFGTPNVVLVTASRYRADGALVLNATKRVQSDTELAALARELEPDRKELIAAAPPAVSFGPHEHPPWFWIGAGAGCALAATGLVFSMTSWSARRELLDGASGHDRVLELTDRMEDHAVAANVFFSAALITTAAGAIVEALE